jgi:hypothetical protein
MKHKHSKLSLMLFAFTVVLTASIASGFTLSGPAAATTNTFFINNGAAYTNSTAVTLTLQFDPAANITKVHYSNDNGLTWSDWENYTTNTKIWNLTAGEGEKTVNVEFVDSYNQVAGTSQKIIVDMTAPTAVASLGLVSFAAKTASFDASYSTDNFALGNCTWDFGDGNQSVAVSTTHVYASSTNYSGVLTVTDLAGNSGNTTFWVNFSNTVTPAPTTPNPTAQPTNIPIQTASPQTTATPTPPPTLDGLSNLTLPIAIIVIVVALAVIVVVVVTRSRVPS